MRWRIRARVSGVAPLGTAGALGWEPAPAPRRSSVLLAGGGHGVVGFSQTLAGSNSAVHGVNWKFLSLADQKNWVLSYRYGTQAASFMMVSSIWPQSCPRLLRSGSASAWSIMVLTVGLLYSP